MRNKFDMQLGMLNEQLIHMGELCELAINRATKALQNGSIEEAKNVIDADQEVDQMEKDIERLCLKLLLQQQPVAKMCIRDSLWHKSTIRSTALTPRMFA